MDPTIRASELVRRALRKVARSSRETSHLRSGAPEGYTLRVVGRRQYLLHDLALWQYAPVQEALNRGERLVLQLVENVNITLPGEGPGGRWVTRLAGSNEMGLMGFGKRGIKDGCDE